MSELTSNPELMEATLTPAEVQPTPTIAPPESAPSTEVSPLTIGGQPPGRVLSFEEGLEFSLKYYDEALRLLAQ